MLIDCEDDPLWSEKMFPSSVMFMESQLRTKNFVQSFVTEADISRQSSDCDLVPIALRWMDRRFSTPKNPRCFAGNVIHEPLKKAPTAVDNLSNRCLTFCNRNLSQSFVSATSCSKTHVKINPISPRGGRIPPGRLSLITPKRHKISK